jgi:histidinol phosphatase-like enzyme (inositol monophosphatase family)
MSDHDNANEQVTARLELAVQAAREAGWITLEYFRSDQLRVDRKSDDSPVTIADRRAEEHLRHRIAEAFPDDTILGEELPERSGSNDFRWILDPIDGTKSFIHDVPLYGTLVGLEQAGRPTAGVIYAPGTQECVYAATGQGAWYVQGKDQPRRAQVSSCRRLDEAVFLTSEIELWARVDRAEPLARVTAATRFARTWGDCYGYLMVATGRAEAMVDPRMAVWDAAALLPILQEAGGRFTDWNNQETIHGGEGVGTNGHLHDEVLRLLKSEE